MVVTLIPERDESSQMLRGRTYFVLFSLALTCFMRLYLRGSGEGVRCPLLIVLHSFFTYISSAQDHIHNSCARTCMYVYVPYEFMKREEAVTWSWITNTVIELELGT